MISILQPLFDTLIPATANPSGPRFSVARFPNRRDCFVGKDAEGKACVLIKVATAEHRHQAPIRLESLEVLFEVPSLIHVAGREERGTFTIMRCRSAEREVTSYFLSVCEAILHRLGASPGTAEIANAVNRLAFIFRKLQQLPVRSINGLFGELFFIRQSRNPTFALTSWRVEQTSRFDFSTGDIRIDVKTASGRSRTHSFSFDQCNPPAGTVAVVASLFVERASGGISIHEIVKEIEQHCAASPDLLIRLHDVLAETIGAALPEALASRFDRKLAETTLQFYDFREVPAIRGDPPAGVTEVHFRSDLSSVRPATVERLIEREPVIEQLLPES